MPNFFDSQLAGVDWLILVVYFVVIIAIGALVSRGTSDEQGFFLGSRRMPAWAVAMSFAATALSAATFIGGPAYAFGADLTQLAEEISKVLAALLVVVLFLPPLYRSGCTTIYGYLGQRISPGSATAAGTVFLLGRVLSSGSRLFIAGTAFSAILYGNTDAGNLIAAIILFGVVGTLYTAIGGIKAVIWTDTLQLLIVIGAVVATIILLLQAIPLPIDEIYTNLQASGKTVVIDTTPDLSMNNTIWAALAMTVFYAAAFGADQDMAQRLLTCKSLKHSIFALISAIFIAMLITAMFMIAGLLLYVFYARPDLMGDAAPAYAVTDKSEAYPQFLLNELPAGVRGLAIAGLFAAALSSLDSAINAMASSVMSDLRRPGAAPSADAGAASRVVVVLMGVLLTLSAVGMVWVYDPESDTLIKFALGVMTFAYAGLMGVFLSVLLTGRGSTASVIAALITGLAVIAASRYVPAASGLGLAFPYWMVIGSAASFAVCLLGSTRGRAVV